MQDQRGTQDVGQWLRLKGGQGLEGTWGHRGLECRHAPHSVDESKHRGHHHDSRDSMIDTTGGSLCELDRLSPCRLLFGQLLICNSGNWGAQRGIVRTTKDTCQSRKSAQQHRQFGLQRRQSPRLESGLSAAAFRRDHPAVLSMA